MPYRRVVCVADMGANARFGVPPGLARTAAGCHGMPRTRRFLPSLPHGFSGARMFGDIARFLIDIVFTLFGAALILRAWMQAVRLPPRNPFSQGIFQLTDWLVVPLRKILPGTGGIDWSSLVGAWLTAVVYLLLVVAVSGGDPLSLFPLVFVIALLTALKWAVNLLMWSTLLMALMSWINPKAPSMALLDILTAPFLNPIRRRMPMIGGMDLSPLLLFVLTQIALMVIARLTFSVFGAF
jgi:YggT family protein